MRRDRSRSNVPILVAAILMVGFFVWLLVQMAPHGPQDGELLVRLVVGLGVAVIGAALVLGLWRLLAGPPGGRRRRR